MSQHTPTTVSNSVKDHLCWLKLFVRLPNGSPWKILVDDPKVNQKALGAPDEIVLRVVSLQKISARSQKRRKREERGGDEMPEKTNVNVSLRELSLYTCNITCGSQIELFTNQRSWCWHLEVIIRHKKGAEASCCVCFYAMSICVCDLSTLSPDSWYWTNLQKPMCSVSSKTFKWCK